MSEKRKILVGDIGGDLGLLKDLLDVVQPSADDFLLFLGSYMGIGPDSKGVLDYLINVQRTFDGEVRFLWGCYEATFMHLTPDASLHLKALWTTMGGAQVLDSYSKDGNIIHTESGPGKIQRVQVDYKIPMDHLEFMEHNLFQWYQDTDYKFVASHAGFNPKNFLNPTMDEVTLGVTVRGVGWWDTDWRLPDTDIVFSHIPHNAPWTKEGKIGIGSFPGYIFSVEFPSKRFHVVGGHKRVTVGHSRNGT